MKKYLIVGDGLIGSGLFQFLKNNQHTVISTTRHPERLNKNTIFFDLLYDDFEPSKDFDTAFLCTGISSFMFCEENPDYTFYINVSAIVNLAKKLLSNGTRVFFISSSAVFGGQIDCPNEDAEYCVNTEYANQKAAAEQQLLSLGNGVIIIRITKLISFAIPIFSRIFKALQLNEICEVFEDLLFSPLSIDYFCRSLLMIENANLEGIFHLSGNRSISYYEFAVELAKYMKKDCNLVKGVSAKSVLFMPRYAGLGMKKTMSHFKIKQENLNAVLKNSYVFP